MFQMNLNNLISQLLGMGPNPQQVEQMLFQRYPHLRIISNQMIQSGMSPLQFAMQVAKQNNIPIQPNMMAAMFQQGMNMIPR